MATEKQIAANRRNAQKSTGPINTSNTRFNATSHGLRGSRVVIDGEDMDEYTAMTHTLHTGLNPVGTYEHNLVKQLADCLWEIERVQVLKANTLNHTEYRDCMQDELLKWERYHRSIERSMIRIRKELSQVQSARGQAYNPQAHQTPQTPILFETVVYKGPMVQPTMSQGEVAIDNLTRRAVAKMKRDSIPYGQPAIDYAVNRLADLQMQHDSSDIDPGDPKPVPW